jgi:hypothetical protein
MCHCKICVVRLHVIIVIIAIAIPYSPASSLVRFQFLHTCVPFTSPRFYALPIVHDTSSKNTKLSSATLFSWRHTNTSKNHGYNAVADDSCGTRNCRLLQLNFRDVTITAARITDIALSRMTCAGSHFVSRIRPSFPTKKVKKVEKVNIFRPYIPYGLFQTKGEMCAKFGSNRFRNVNLYKVQTNKHSALYIRFSSILLPFLLCGLYCSAFCSSNKCNLWQ